MIKQLYDLLYKSEENYWWFTGQKFLTEHYIRKNYKARKNLRLLDVGCGTGATIKLLSRYGKPYGIDLSDNAIRYCRLKGIDTVKKSNVMKIRFMSSMFDVVTSLGVFYHKNIKDDIKGMKEINRVLKPGGRLIFFDCAMMCLYGKHDIAFDGIRRYSKQELESKLRKAGFEVESISYITTFPFPLVYLKRKLEKFSKSNPKSEVNEKINPLLNSLLKIIYGIELHGIDYISYPFGINIIAVARKP